jgi:hypothetical protein
VIKEAPQAVPGMQTLAGESVSEVARELHAEVPAENDIRRLALDSMIHGGRKGSGK